MQRAIIYITFLFPLFAIFEQPKAVQLKGNAQGTTWLATYYARDSVVRKHDIDSILEVIDSSLSLYKPYSLIVTFNNSERGIKMDEHLKRVVQRSIEITRETKGLSDITVAPLVDAWGFGVNRRDSLPSATTIGNIMPCIGSDKIYVKGDSLIKSTPCTKIDANGIAQGYSVDIIASYLDSKGVRDYLVELGGELRIRGKKPSGEMFRIGVESPGNDEFTAMPMQKIIELKTGAITTSGNYRRFHESGGKRYTHIINPKTGQPVQNEVISVSVFARDAITADAYDNALLLMGMESALRFVNARNDLAAFIIYKQADGSIADTTSSRFNELFLQKPKISDNQ